MRDSQPFNQNFHIQACYQLNQSDFERELSPLQKVEGERGIVYFEKDSTLPDEREGVKMIHFFDFVEKYCSNAS
ncbi:MAG: hypothetical protein LBG52_01530 [Candidatus Peribacteria bacterium]|jgi:hypothetical protein|nr:hypothetical protein [Candidatus Peribacteria bacterium]